MKLTLTGRPLCAALLVASMFVPAVHAEAPPNAKSDATSTARESVRMDKRASAAVQTGPKNASKADLKTAAKTAKAAKAAAKAAKPNILFVVIDDVGVDQLTKFNPAGVNLPNTPVIDSLCTAGVRFTNVWGMPECSPSRSAIMTGRYPFRTTVLNACLPTAPPRSQTSPYEFTVPQMLATAGYASGYMGKLHLGDPTLNPAGDGYPGALGFPYFSGTPYGGPSFIDITLAGQMPPPAAGELPMYSCGFPVDSATNSPAVCSCGFPDGTWSDNIDAVDCFTLGGVPLVNSDGTTVTKGSAAAWARVDFDDTNGFYSMPRALVVEGSPVVNTIDHVYESTQDVDLALQWIKAQKAGTPWMCTVAFVTAHDPYQPVPYHLLAKDYQWPSGLPYVCGPQADLTSSPAPSEREIMNQMVEASDREIGRLLVEAKVAEWSGNGVQMLDSNTTVVFIGDNGSFLDVVRAPFDPLRGKGYVNQTGVCVPMIIAGARVNAPGRSVDAMVNLTDLFQLFGELAGVDVRAAVPASHALDCQSMIGYLTDPQASPVRTVNFAQNGTNLSLPEGQLRACVIVALTSAATCSDAILYSEQLCVSTGGVWFDDYAKCCDLRAAAATDAALYAQCGDFAILPPSAMAATDGHYKLIIKQLEGCDQSSKCAFEFYDLTTAPFNHVLLGGRGVDFPSVSLLPSGDAACSPGELTPEAAAAFTALQSYMYDLMATQPACLGDGNIDGVIDSVDLAEIATWWGQSSVYDFNNDGTTDGSDLAQILTNWGPCSR